MRVEENVTGVTYSLKFWSDLNIFPSFTSLLKFRTNVIPLKHSYFIYLLCVCVWPRPHRSCSLDVQQSSSNASVHTIAQVTYCSRPNVSSTAPFLQRILLVTEAPVWQWECVNSVKLMMDTSCWQPTCLVPCQPTSCQWWANCPAPHLVDKWTAASSPGNFEKKPNKYFPIKEIDSSDISLQFLELLIGRTWAIFRRAESPEAPWLLHGHVFHAHLFFSRNRN